MSRVSKEGGTICSPQDRRKVERIYSSLYAYYGELNWWPAQSPFGVMVGAILTQNTTWTNVELALAQFGSALTPELIANLPRMELEALIRPAGFYRQKALYLKELTAWFARYNYAVPTVQKQSLPQLRQELLTLKGVGSETADSILLYALGYPSFVVDAYTRRLGERYPLALGQSYATAKAFFEGCLPAEPQLFNNYHALIVSLAKEFCRPKPRCQGCPLADGCGGGGSTRS